jgi:hypothetical protein
MAAVKDRPTKFASTAAFVGQRCLAADFNRSRDDLTTRSGAVTGFVGGMPKP